MLIELHYNAKHTHQHNFFQMHIFKLVNIWSSDVCIYLVKREEGEVKGDLISKTWLSIIRIYHMYSSYWNEYKGTGFAKGHLQKDFEEGKKANACKYHFMLDMFVLHLSVSWWWDCVTKWKIITLHCNWTSYVFVPSKAVNLSNVHTQASILHSIKSIWHLH